ncbi:hypothetical protein ACLKA6_016601 [Drosophila palustris]
MLVLASSHSCFILLLLLLQLPGNFVTLSSSLEPASFQSNYLNNYIQNVLEKKTAETLLILKRRQDLNCVLKEFHSHHLIPTLRLDESTIINVKDLFNSEAIALVCMSELADSMLLTSLAKDLHRMRETRIIIWLQDIQSNLTAFLDIITDQASNHNFLSLIVLYSISTDVNGSIAAYRLHPFPSPTLKRIMDLNNGVIFPIFWKNFRNKTAVGRPNLNPPASFLTSSHSCFILLLLLLQLPGNFVTLSSSLEPASFQSNYLNNFIQNVLEEKSAETLLILKRRQDRNCVLKEFHSHHLIPTLRLDEYTIINIKDVFNSEAIALVCMSELADSMLLTSLAKDLHMMRETRIIIWLQDIQSALNAFLEFITDQASIHNFLSLIVLLSTSTDVNGSIAAYRLHPFPSPTLKRIIDLNNGVIFPIFWRNFCNKTAVGIPNLNPPASFLTSSHRCFILLLLLLQLTGNFVTLSSLLEPASFQSNYLNNFIQNVLEEKSAETLLILKRRQDRNCVLKEFHSHHIIPTLRLDEYTIINIKDVFNSEAIALVCMSELADSMLLTSLAKDLHMIRETRIIIWLQDIQSALNAFLEFITDQASNHNFLSLIVLRSTSTDLELERLRHAAICIGPKYDTVWF